MAIEISAASGKPSVMESTESVLADAAMPGCHLVFNKYKNMPAFSQVFPGGGNRGYQLMQGDPEKLAAKTEQPTKQSASASAK